MKKFISHATHGLNAPRGLKAPKARGGKLFGKSGSRTGDRPLIFAKAFSKLVNEAWENGSFLSAVSPVSQDLLRFWFAESFVETRQGFNFHKGQRQAILNTIYAHEVLRTQTISDIYDALLASTQGAGLFDGADLSFMRGEKFFHPKYCLKMATGTGKTWVLAALLIWQYLNARNEDVPSGRFSKNFLLVAPGLIVYERLLDSYLGRESASGVRDFNTSDFYQNRDLFLPDVYRHAMLSFIQASVVCKEEIGLKTTGDGLIAITNWHRLKEEGEDEDYGDDVHPLEDPSYAVKEIFPLTPGVSSGQSLDTLDAKFLRGRALDFLKSLPALTVFNDEAHHIHENVKAGEESEVEWQKTMNALADCQQSRFIQIDFSATPYDVQGSGQNRTKNYFAHIIVDFDLNTAIHDGLVKTIAIDRRKELNVPQLDFNAIRDGDKIIGLSEGQRLMLRAGLEKLKRLEEAFVGFAPDKYPKMLVICEDTKVSPFVVDFLKSEGLFDEDVLRIDSDKKGEIPKKQWEVEKQRLFNLDKRADTKVVVSVLMLREGFDVNNICVIVPLRSSQAPILLEQVIGRGLRLMWRGEDYSEIKQENRKRLLIEKKDPNNYLDILSIIEHPAYIQFYDDLNNYDISVNEHELTDRKSILGDLVSVGLKEAYGDFDLYWPVITKEREEFLEELPLTIDNLKPVDWFSLEQLRKRKQDKKGETFFIRRNDS